MFLKVDSQRSRSGDLKIKQVNGSKNFSILAFMPCLVKNRCASNLRLKGQNDIGVVEHRSKIPTMPAVELEYSESEVNAIRRLQSLSKNSSKKSNIYYGGSSLHTTGVIQKKRIKSDQSSLGIAPSPFKKEQVHDDPSSDISMSYHDEAKMRSKPCSLEPNPSMMSELTDFS